MHYSTQGMHVYCVGLDYRVALCAICRPVKSHSFHYLHTLDLTLLKELLLLTYSDGAFFVMEKLKTQSIGTSL